MTIFGENAFAVRLPSALTTGLAAFLLFYLVLKSRKDPEEALLATGIFLTFGMVFGIGTFAVLDAQTTFFVTGTLITFYWGCEQEKWNWKKFTALAAAGIFAGLAFLTKGFLAFGVPAVTIIPYLIWTKRWKQIFILPWIPLIFTIIISLPWSLMIHKQAPDFWDYFFWNQHVKRFFDNEGIHHPEPFYFFIPFLFVGAMPVILFIAPAFTAFKKRFKELLNDKLVKFCICWFLFPFLLFSASSGKLPTYILPCFAPLAVLFARGLLEYFRSGKTKLFNVTAKVLMILFLLGAVGFAVVQIIADFGVFRGIYGDGELWKWIFACSAAGLWIFCLYKSYKSSKYRSKLAFLLIGPLVALFASHLAVPLRYIEGKAQGIFLEPLKKEVKPGMKLVVHPNIMHAAAWEFRNTDILFYTHGGELEEGLKEKSNKGRIISRDEFLKMVKENPKSGNIIFIMRGDFREGIPSADYEKYEHGIMFSKY
jgi:4-amino-4-deoxy-L-arabinose transferase